MKTPATRDNLTETLQQSAVTKSKQSSLVSNHPDVIQQNRLQSLARNSIKLEPIAQLQSIANTFPLRSPYKEHNLASTRNDHTSPNPHSVIQRMSIVFEDAHGQGIDQIGSEDLVKTHELVGGIAMPFSKLRNSSTPILITPGESIALIGHGSTTGIEGIPPRDIVTALLNIRNLQDAKVLYVSSCEGAKEVQGNDSVLDKIIAGLERNKIRIPGIGYCGYAVHQFDNMGELSGDIAIDTSIPNVYNTATGIQNQVAGTHNFALGNFSQLPLDQDGNIDIAALGVNIQASLPFYKELGEEFEANNILLPANQSMRRVEADKPSSHILPTAALDLLRSKDEEASFFNMKNGMLLGGGVAGIGVLVWYLVSRGILKL